MTSTNHNDARKLIQIIGQVDVFEDSTASDTVISVFTAEGEEYVVVARKIVRRLLRFAGEEIDIHFYGYVNYDSSSGLDVLSVVSFKPMLEEETKAPDTASDYNRDASHKKRKKTIVPDLDDDEVNAEDFDQAEGFDTIIIHEEGLTGLTMDDDDLDLDDLDPSILDDIVKETLAQDEAPAPEPAPAANPMGKTPPAAKKIPPRRRAPDQTATMPDATPASGRQAKKTEKKTIDRLDKPSAVMTPKDACRSTASGTSPVAKTAKSVGSRAPTPPVVRKDTTAPPPIPAPKMKSAPPPPKQISSLQSKKTSVKPPLKKVSGGPPAAARPQDANVSATGKKHAKASTAKASIPVVPSAPKTVPKSSGPARSRKRQS